MFSRRGINLFNDYEVAFDDASNSYRMEFTRNGWFEGAYRFIERWILDAPAGVFIKPENMAFQRVDPNLWGSSLKYYSGPPVRVDLDISVLINIDNP